MPGINPQSLENHINRAPVQDGVVVSRAFPDPLCWSAYDSDASPDLQGLAGTLTVAGYTADKCGAGLPDGVGTADYSFNVLQFNGTANGAHALACEIPLTESVYVPYRSTSAPRKLVLKFGVRRVGSGTAVDGNTLGVYVYAKVPGDATVRPIVESFIYTLPAKVSTLTFTEFEVDVVAQTETEELGGLQYLVANTILKVLIIPNEAAGTNMAIEILPLSYTIREHLATGVMADREPLI